MQVFKKSDNDIELWERTKERKLSQILNLKPSLSLLFLIYVSLSNQLISPSWFVPVPSSRFLFALTILSLDQIGHERNITP